MPAKKDSEMNLRALMALSGSSIDWRADLVLLLRSDAPLDRSVRDRLAMLVENVTGSGPQIELTGHKASRDRFAGVASRHEWMDIGRWVSASEKADVARAQVSQAAASHFGLGIKKVEAAVTYYNKVMVWVDHALLSEAGKDLGRAWLERLYHSITVYPEMRQANNALLRELGLSH